MSLVWLLQNPGCSTDPSFTQYLVRVSVTDVIDKKREYSSIWHTLDWQTMPQLQSKILNVLQLQLNFYSPVNEISTLSKWNKLFINVISDNGLQEFRSCKRSMMPMDWTETLTFKLLPYFYFRKTKMIMFSFKVYLLRISVWAQFLNSQFIQHLLLYWRVSW